MWLLGDKVMNSEYRITNSGSRIFVDVEVKNEFVTGFYANVAIVKEEDVIVTVSLKDFIFKILS